MKFSFVVGLWRSHGYVALPCLSGRQVQSGGVIMGITPPAPSYFKRGEGGVAFRPSSPTIHFPFPQERDNDFAIALSFVAVIFFFVLSLSHLSFAKETPIYKYKDKNGVVLFTNNIESIPKSLRGWVEIMKEEPLKEVERDSPSFLRQKGDKAVKPVLPSRMRSVKEILPLQGFFQEGLKNRTMIIGLLLVIGILLIWCLKLWIKNFIIQWIARVLIKVAFVGLLYVMIHYMLIDPQSGSFSRLPKAVKEAVEPYTGLIPIKKAKENIKRFEESQKEKARALDALPSNP